MPSPAFRTLRTVFRARSGKRFSDPESSRRELEEFVRILPAPGPYRAERVTLGGVACEWVVPEGLAVERTLVFLHGGGYVSGSLDSHRGLAARLAHAAGARAFQVDYRRAPEHPFPAAFDDARAVLAEVLTTERIAAAAPASGPLPVVVVGDSAGGGLALAATVALRDAGAPVPEALVCLSPWTDLACTGETLTTRAAADPLFDRPSLERMAALYAGIVDKTDPRMSPLYADLHDLPPTLIQVGDAEVLLADSTRLAERLEAAGVPVEVEVWPEMVHGWQLFAGMVPEGDEAIEAIGRFLRAATPAPTDRSSAP